MKITINDLINGKEWLHKEILESVTNDIVFEALDLGYYDVKLLVNGKELEPLLYNKLVNNIERYIDDQAKSIVIGRLREAENKANTLVSLIESAKDSIVTEFNLSEEDI